MSVASAAAQEPAIHNDEPALKFRARGDFAYVHLVEYGGEAALRFPVWHMHSTLGSQHCKGYLYLTSTRVAYDPVLAEGSEFKQDGFEQQRTALESTPKRYRRELHLSTATRKYRFDALDERGAVDWTVDAAAWQQFFLSAFSDFDGAVKIFKSSTARLVPLKPTPPAEPPRPGSIRVVAQPGGLQVYVNDQFKGITSGEEGVLVIADMKPGSYRVRLTQPGYKDWTSTIAVAAGEEQKIAAELTLAGPKPLELAEIEQALTNFVPKARNRAHQPVPRGFRADPGK